MKGILVTKWCAVMPIDENAGCSTEGFVQWTPLVLEQTHTSWSLWEKRGGIRVVIMGRLNERRYTEKYGQIKRIQETGI